MKNTYISKLLITAMLVLLGCDNKGVLLEAEARGGKLELHFLFSKDKKFQYKKTTLGVFSNVIHRQIYSGIYTVHQDTIFLKCIGNSLENINYLLTKGDTLSMNCSYKNSSEKSDNWWIDFKILEKSTDWDNLSHCR
jgi:hypothetical protein